MAAQTSILKYLQQNNLIDEEGVRKILLERSRSNKSEETLIREFNLASDVDIAKAKSAILVFLLLIYLLFQFPRVLLQKYQLITWQSIGLFLLKERIP